MHLHTHVYEQLPVVTESYQKKENLYADFCNESIGKQGFEEAQLAVAQQSILTSHLFILTRSTGFSF